MAGTYMAEQMSPEQCTLLSATSPGPKKRVVGAGGDAKMKRRQFIDIKDGAGCTILPALEAIDPLLAKADPDEQAPAKPRKGAPSRVEPSPKQGHRRQGGPNHDASSLQSVSNRLYMGASQFSSLEDVLDKSNEELVAWLSRPKQGEEYQTQRGRLNAASSANASQASKVPDSPQSNHSSKSPRQHSPNPPQPHERIRSTKKRHKTYDELFEAALQGVGTTSSSRVKTYMPGKAGQRLKPLVGQIQPICILPENAVEALKESDRQKARALESLHALSGEKKDRNVNSVVSKALSKFQKGKSSEPTEPLDRGAPKAPVDLGTRLSSMVESLGREGLSELKKENSADDNLEGISQNQKMPQIRKEASEALRSFIYGPDAYKALDKEQREKLLYEPHGTKIEVIGIERVWNALDDDNSGRVNIQEFRAFAQKSGAHVQKLTDKVMGPLLGKKSSFTIEDMMRIVWPCATLNDVKNMKKWIEEYHAYVKPMKAPQVIKQEELEALIHNFKFFDQDSSGQVTFAELTESGLLDKDMADRYMQEWDDDGSGELSQMEFCEMFCMAGYRVHEEAQSATDSDGNRLVFIEEGQIGWHRKDEWEAFLKGTPLKSQPIDVSL